MGQEEVKTNVETTPEKNVKKDKLSDKHINKSGGGETQKTSSEEKIDFIKWFSELNRDSGSIAGGKGANLSEIFNLKISVPPGFVVTAQAYDYFIKKAKIEGKIKELLERINYEDTEQLNKITGEIRGIIEKAEFPEKMKEEILEAYEALGAEDSGIKDRSAHYILRKSPEAPFVAVRSSATTEDLPEASFAGQQDTFLNVKGSSELLTNIKKCFSSLFTPRATYYRNKKKFRHEQASLAVIVQKMIDSDKSGVIFSKDPSMKKDHVIIEAVFGLGEGIVSGKITPDRYYISKELEIQNKEIGKKKIAVTRDSGGKKEVVKLKEEISEKQVLKEHEIKKLAGIALKLEEHYKKPQDIEFAIENNEIYIVQTRPITTLEKRVESGRELQGEVILKGLAASPGIASGKIIIVENFDELKKVSQGDVLVTKMTNPDMVVTMQKSAAIVTDEGGLTAHAAIVSREMGIPAVVGTHEATTKLKEGEIITVNGFTGKIYKGKISESVRKEIRPVTSETKTKIKVIIDLPSFAERAAKTKLKGVGLARIEGTIAESGKHPDYFLEKGSINEYEEIVFKGIRQIADYFDEIWVRTSDIRSDEFKDLEGSPKEKEANPMLGMHGIRYGIKHPEVLKAELKAMKRVAGEGKKIGILSPQIISVDEIKKLKEFIREIEFSEAKVGVMIETPSSVQIIKELCSEGIDFVSFGTNDLTQYTLAVDRGNEQVQEFYNEMHPAVLNQLEYVLENCKKSGVETSICGQAGSRKEMVKFLVERNIDSISVNADAAAEIAEYVAELEGGKKGIKKEEPAEDFVKPQPIIPEEEPKSQKTTEKPEEKKEIKTAEAKEENAREPRIDNAREPRIEEELPKIKGVENLQEKIPEAENLQGKEGPVEKEEALPEEKSSDNNISEGGGEQEQSQEQKEEPDEEDEEALDIF